MNILIAPHPDDELIGAFSLIKRGLIGKVLYLTPTPDRLRRAIMAGRELGFGVDTIEFKDFYGFLQSNPSHTYLVPDNADSHPLHQAINCIARQSICRLGYYTTNMNTGYTKELSKEWQEEKRATLNRYYPDQSFLWECDWKYFLFEGVVLEF